MPQPKKLPRYAYLLALCWIVLCGLGGLLAANWLHPLIQEQTRDCLLICFDAPPFVIALLGGGLCGVGMALVGLALVVQPGYIVECKL